MTATDPTDARSDLQPSVAVIGGGPAGLMAAEAASMRGCMVDVYDRMGSVGRKFLIAGKGGLNLTHSEALPQFIARFAARSAAVAGWLHDFGPDQLRAWARGFGIETFVGSSGRVFPTDLKAAPLLRAWVRRLRERGIRFHVNHRWQGWTEQGRSRLIGATGTPIEIEPGATVLAMGGGSWPVLGSDGEWFAPLQQRGIDLRPLQASNCGFDVGWSAHFAARFAGAAVKPATLSFPTHGRWSEPLQGEFVVTADGVEGSLIYALSAGLRDAIAVQGSVELRLDLLPGWSLARVQQSLERPRAGRSLTEHLRRAIGIEGVKTGLLYERLSRTELADPATLAARMKALPLVLQRPRPLAEAISTAGGVALEALDERLMIRALPGVFCAGEMLDWEAPTGGYLLTASMASGRLAGIAAADFATGQREFPRAE